MAQLSWARGSVTGHDNLQPNSPKAEFVHGVIGDKGKRRPCDKPSRTRRATEASKVDGNRHFDTRTSGKTNQVFVVKRILSCTI